MTGYVGYLYDQTDYTFLFETSDFHWAEDRNQEDIDLVLVYRLAPDYPFTPLNTPGFNTTNFTAADTMTGTYFDGVSYVDYIVTYAFDDNGYPAEVITLKNPDSEWHNFEWSLYEFDENGNNIGTTYHVGGEPDEWVPVRTWVYNYDDQNHLVSFQVTAWDVDTEEWYDFSRFNMEFEDGLWVTDTREQFIDGEWVYTDRWLLDYDDNDNITSYTSLVWSGDQWVNTTKLSYQYDASGDQTSRITYTWADDQWLEVGVSTFEYDDDHHCITAEMEWWNPDSASVQKYMKFYYSYTDLGHFEEIYSESWNGTEYKPMSFADAKVTLFYEDFETGTEDRELKPADIELYPNPASDRMHVKLRDGLINRIRVFDITGKVVYETKGDFVFQEATIPVGQLHHGIYVLEVSSGAHTGSKSFVVSR